MLVAALLFHASPVLVFRRDGSEYQGVLCQIDDVCLALLGGGWPIRQNGRPGIRADWREVALSSVVIRGAVTWKEVGVGQKLAEPDDDQPDRQQTEAKRNTDR